MPKTLPLWPVRCFSNHVICTVKNIAKWKKMSQYEEDMGKILDAMGIKDLCCRTVILTTTSKMG
jgi:DNA-directed RNA polymerase subunit N (RpoN/RPB10)